jgi:predicted phage replisome organizer
MSVRDSKRYFWLKLKEDFFDDDAISWLEEQNKGKEYALFYLKLCLKSLKNDGVLIRRVGNILVPYDTKKIGEITRTDEDTVIVAMELLKKIGLIELQENGALYMTQLSTMIGSETNGAERKRRYREAQKKLSKWDNVPQLSQNCPKHFPLEKELELEKDKEIDRDKDSSGCSQSAMYDSTLADVNKEYENSIIITPPPSDYKTLADLVDEYTAEYVIHAIKEAAFQNVRRLSYIEGILKNWKKDNVPKPWEKNKKDKPDDYGLKIY